MEQFLQSLDSALADKLKTIYKLCEDIFISLLAEDSDYIFKEFLDFLFKKFNEPTLGEYDKDKICMRDAGCQTDFESHQNANTPPVTNVWNIENIAHDVASVAQKNVDESGFVYDESSGLYYDHKLQCYYIPETKLYYCYQTGAYYYYDEESKGLQFYCKASTENSNISTIKNVHETTDKGESSQQLILDTENENSRMSIKKMKSICIGERKEEGECTDSDEETETRHSPSPAVIEAGPKSFEPDHSKHIAPCIRVLVKSSLLNKPSPGTLFIVTCTGGTLGREGDHDVLIPDLLVSKHHTSFRYVFKDGNYFYEIMDMGSKNGTFLNGKRLSESLIQSEPFEVSHGSILTVGNTNLLCHIHPKDEICQDCEAYSISNQEKNEDLSNDLTLKEKYNYERSAIRKKFGIVNSSVTKFPPGYEDRSETRRKTKGSSHPSEKTSAASIDSHIDKKNKGFLLMTKMGWKEGTSLGKSEGIIEPIQVERNDGKSGLGSEKSEGNINLNTKEIKKMAIAKKTRERFKNWLCSLSLSSPHSSTDTHKDGKHSNELPPHFLVNLEEAHNRMSKIVNLTQSNSEEEFYPRN